MKARKSNEMVKGYIQCSTSTLQDWLTTEKQGQGDEVELANMTEIGNEETANASFLYPRQRPWL